MEKFINLKNELFKKDLKNSGEINIANYTTNIENVYTNRFMVKINVINLTLTMFFAVISIVYIKYKLLPISIIGASLPLLIPPLIFGKNIQEKSRKFNEFYDFYQKYIGKKLDQKNEYLRYKVEDKLIEEKSRIEYKHEKNRKDLKNITTFSNISSQSLGSISYILIFIFGGLLAFKGEIEVGSIISIVQLMNYIVDPVIALSSLISMYNESKPIYENIKNILNQKESKKKSLDLSYPIDLFVKNISFSYENKKIIDDFNFDFSYGNKYLIRGESGKGKSTLAKILCGEISPNKGEILLNGGSIKYFDYRDYILYIDQNPNIIDGSLEDNINFYRKKRYKKLIYLFLI
ncbi:MAG: ABC transporter ATP-binding protein [Anaerococcus hydrogenalis]|nr:ABC transporter ATP-binding protein [Anaerococcus hydrogenalis]